MFGRALVSGLAGGLLSVANGGNFGDGFIGAFASSLAGNIKGLGFVGGLTTDIIARFVARVVIGGTISEISGGKFANGAISAAFAALFDLWAAVEWGMTQPAETEIDAQEYGQTEPKRVTTKISPNEAQRSCISTSVDERGNGAFNYRGTVYSDGLDPIVFQQWVDSINAMNGTTVTKGIWWWKKTMTLNVSLTVTTDLSSANIVMRPTSGNSGVPMLNVRDRGRVSWSERTIFINGSLPFFALNGPHEFLHLMGVGHSRNSGCGVMSYCFDINRRTGAATGDQRTYQSDSKRLFNLMNAY